MKLNPGRAKRQLFQIVWFCLCACAVPPAQGQTAPKRNTFEVLDQFSASVQALAARVAPSVVQIQATRFGPRDGTAVSRTGLVVGKQQSLGSGVIIDPDGYIVTNAHVVADAQTIRVRMLTHGDQSISSALALSYSPLKDASLVGVYKDGDLALLKIAGTGWPALPFADYKDLRQGQVVFAFGSPEGLSNSVSMGVVSSVARQPDPDTPFIYIQTDAPINPGNSGGPLVNTAGAIVGLDTFILTQSGGSEGISFAIPAPLIQFVSGQLRKYGHVHRVLIGAGVQTITSTLATALNLPRATGVIVSDVFPGGPADNSGVKLNDVVLTVDGRAIDNLPMFMMSLLQHAEGQHVNLGVLRHGETLSLDIEGAEEAHPSDRLADLVDPEKSQIPKLGIVALAIDKKTAALFPGLRNPSGVVVVARSEAPSGNGAVLQVGDVIHEVNGTVVTTVDALQAAVSQIKRTQPVALFIERDAKLLYVTFEME